MDRPARCNMSTATPIFTGETSAFSRALASKTRKDWRDANRERYGGTVVEPFRRLLEELSPAVVRLDSQLGSRASFSRINRDIRFAKDKTPYRPQMYLK